MENIEYDYSKLRGLIREYCGTQKAYAQALGIGTTALTQRLANKQPFTQDEIRKSRILFHLDRPELVDEVFFTTK